jgi:peptidoglycan/xylan/chitin deacetylase (PgdA/CDA1 family)
MLARMKSALFSSAEALGLSALVLHSNWRRRRLMILSYHGVSLSDEHDWSPALYMPPALFRRRLETLSRLGCNVLPLDEALARLRAGELPPRSVALTFDDGSYDTYAVAAPIVRDFGFPATIYYTTYYAIHNRPVFDVMCSYLLWKAGPVRLHVPGIPEALDLAGRGYLAEARRLKEFAWRAGYSAREKDTLLASVAESACIDYDAICRSRLLHLMKPSEIHELAEAGFDVQLHTHRHRVSRVRALFEREIEDNRRNIAAVTSRPARHFCYPCGVYRPEYRLWMQALGVDSATTCDPGLAMRRSDPYLLPRLVDSTNIPDVTFRAWISGLASLVPHRPAAQVGDQFIEDQQPELLESRAVRRSSRQELPVRKQGVH